MEQKVKTYLFSFCRETGEPRTQRLTERAGAENGKDTPAEGASFAVPVDLGGVLLKGVVSSDRTAPEIEPQTRNRDKVNLGMQMGTIVFFP